jgi:hypothetical protein
VSLAFLRQMHLKPSEIQRIATEFGITLPRAIQSALNNHPVHVNVGPGGRVVVPHGAAERRAHHRPGHRHVRLDPGVAVQR